MTAREAMRYCFDAVTMNAAAGDAARGLRPRRRLQRRLVVLQAADPIEAIRLKAPRLYVVRRGKVIASTPAKVATLRWPDARTA